MTYPIGNATSMENVHPALHNAYVDVKAHFAGVGNGTTDDTAAIQAAINSVPTTGSAGVPGTKVYLPPGTYRVTSTLNIHQKSLIVSGAGVGNPTNYSTPGNQTTLMWDGAAAGTMFNVRDSKWVTFEDILFQGNSTNVPAELIYFQNAGGSIGTNAQLFVNRCHFGRFTWTNPSTSGTAATVGIRFGGTNANNDQFHFADVVFEGCATGVKIDNSQSVWGLISNALFDGSTTAGITTSAEVELHNATFNACALDLDINSTARVTVRGYYSEGATQCAELSGQGWLGVFGGQIINHAGMTTNTIDHQSCGTTTGGLLLVGLRMAQAGLTHRKVKVRGVGTGGGTRGTVTVIDCQGWDFADLDIANVAGGDVIDVTIVSNGMSLYRTLAASATLSTGGWEFSSGSVVVGGGAALATDATDGFLYIPTCAGTPTGAPTAKTGSCAMVFDTTNNKLYIFDGNWKGATTPGTWV